MMKYHCIIGLTSPSDQECRFCGRTLRILSTDETHVKMDNEHVHFSMVDHFYAICHHCKLRTHWFISPDCAKIPQALRSRANYRRDHGTIEKPDVPASTIARCVCEVLGRANCQLHGPPRHRPA